MGMREWNVYRRGGGQAVIGDLVRHRGEPYRVDGTQGADADGVPYVRLVPVGDGGGEGRRIVRCLLTAVERVVPS